MSLPLNLFVVKLQLLEAITVVIFTVTRSHQSVVDKVTASGDRMSSLGSGEEELGVQQSWV